MRAQRVDMHRLQELVRMHRFLKMFPNTEREYREALLAAGLLAGPVDELPELGAIEAA